jgi:hypothetical protein
MREKVVLPKFRVPGLRSHWSIRALWVVAGLVFVQMGVFALLMWKQQEPEAVAAEAAGAPSSASAAPAAPVARLEAAKVPASKSTANAGEEAPSTSAAVAARGDDAPLKKKRFRRHSARRGHRAVGGSTKVLAKAGGPAKKSSKKSDAIDELLKRFK